MSADLPASGGEAEPEVSGLWWALQLSKFLSPLNIVCLAMNGSITFFHQSDGKASSFAFSGAAALCLSLGAFFVTVLVLLCIRKIMQVGL